MSVQVLMRIPASILDGCTLQRASRKGPEFTCLAVNCKPEILQLCGLTLDGELGWATDPFPNFVNLPHSLAS